MKSISDILSFLLQKGPPNYMAELYELKNIGTTDDEIRKLYNAGKINIIVGRGTYYIKLPFSGCD